MITLRSFPLIAAVVPFVGVTASYAIAVHYDLVPSCIPYIDGCTSISATGRYEPASYLFRAIQMPLGVLHIAIWILSVEWLKGMGQHSQTAHRLVLYGGLVGGISLIIYVTFLGTQQPFYEFMRRFGIYGYFLGAAVAQLTLALAVRSIDLKTVRFGDPRQGALLVWLAALPFVLGVLNLVLRAILEDPDTWENRIEWVAALIMQLYFLFLWNAWRVTGFRARVHTDVH